MLVEESTTRQGSTNVLMKQDDSNQLNPRFEFMNRRLCTVLEVHPKYLDAEAIQNHLCSITPFIAKPARTGRARPHS